MKRKKVKDDAIFIFEVLNFYEKSGRHDLIWRKKITPYTVLVSEIMLQQTQVERVLPKFKIWIEIYPTLRSLKSATLQDILTLWQGLGYQRRAKALYEIAQVYTKIPNKFEALCGMPGIGPYTASAICAFAYNNFAYPMLETNIRTALIETYHQGEEKIHDGLLYDDMSRLVIHKTIQKIGARKWYYACMDYGAYLKGNKISHNQKSVHYTQQTIYKGSLRELRAKILFAIIHKEQLPNDERKEKVLEKLTREGYIIKQKNMYKIKDSRSKLTRY